MLDPLLLSRVHPIFHISLLKSYYSDNTIADFHPLPQKELYFLTTDVYLQDSIAKLLMEGEYFGNGTESLEQEDNDMEKIMVVTSKTKEKRGGVFEEQPELSRELGEKEVQNEKRVSSKPLKLPFIPFNPTYSVSPTHNVSIAKTVVPHAFS